MALIRIYQEVVSWEKLRKIEVPEVRVYTKKTEEKEESIRNAIREDSELFFHRSPIIVTKSAESERLFLADGADRLRIAVEEKAPRVILSVEEYESDSEAYEAAQDSSYRLNEDRGDVVAYSLVELVKERHKQGKTVKEIAQRLGKSESHIYNILAVSADEELMNLLREEKITLKEAIRAAYNPELKREILIKTPLTVRVEAEKPISEEIQLREERIGEIEPSTVVSKEIEAKKPRFEEIFKKAVELVEEQLHRPMNATLKAHMEDALRGLKIMNVDELKYILLAAENNWGKEKSEVQKKAVWIWRRKLDELGDWKKWHTLDYKEILEEAREEVEAEKKARKAEVSFREVYREPRPRAEKPRAVEVEKPPRVEVEEPRPSPTPVVEEAGVSEEYEKAVEAEDKRVGEELRKMLISFFPKAGDPWILVGDLKIKRILDEVGLLGMRIVLSRSYWRLREILTPREPLIRIKKLGVFPPQPLIRLRKDEVVSIIAETYEAEREKIVEVISKLGEDVCQALYDTLKNSDIYPLDSQDGRRYLILCRQTPKVVIGVKRDIFMNEGANRLSEALAWISPGDREVGENVGEAKLSIVRASPKYSPPAYFRAYVAGMVCPNCRRLLTDHITGLPVNCACGWPTIESQYQKGVLKGAREVR